MSMKTLTILQFIEMFSAYILMTTVVPFLVLRPKIRHRRLAEQFLCSLMVGNFYIINLVFLLQFLKLSYRITLAAGTIFPAVLMWMHIRHIRFRDLWRHAKKTIRLLLDGHMGIKTVVFRILERAGDNMKKAAAFCFRAFYRHIPEWIFVGAILCALGWFYGSLLLRAYGYSASDSPVHLWWINGLSSNQVFIDGVYPMGFHCIIYYLHSIFNIDSYVFMRIFGFVQTIMLHMVLLSFLRLCCKSKYLAYAAVGLFVLGDFLQPSTYLRFFAVLPQEYGIIFILPSIYFLFQFFRTRRKEIRKKTKFSESRAWLFYFAISFSMTLAVHFYDTMVAGLYCLGVAGGYFLWIFRKKYFVPILVSGLISVMLAVTPMGFAFVTGTPLQGSLGWGMSVINGTDDEFLGNASADEEEENEDEETRIMDSSGNIITFFDENGNAVPVSKLTKEQLESLEEMGATITSTSEGAVSNGAVSGGTVSGAALSDLIKSAPQKSIREKLKNVWVLFGETITGAVLNNPPYSWYYLVLFGTIALLYVLGLFYLLFASKRQYGAMLLSTGFFMTLMLCLLSAGGLGLPALMDSARCRIFFAYMVPVAAALAVDAVITLLTWPRILHFMRGILSFACVVLVIMLLRQDSYRKKPVESTPLVTNEAITCLTNIIHSEKDETWTICSANDELQMGVGHGYHYELITFLKGMEYNKMKLEDHPNVQIPTENVFIFIEKVPLDYTVSYENSGQRISEEGAEYDLPNVGGIGMYMGENRWILMSRIYFWAQEFKKKYPNDVKVYLETDRFVCYKIKQNTYRLFNFAIDYDYNTRRWGQEEIK